MDPVKFGFRWNSWLIRFFMLVWYNPISLLSSTYSHLMDQFDLILCPFLGQWKGFGRLSVSSDVLDERSALQQLDQQTPKIPPPMYLPEGGTLTQIWSSGKTKNSSFPRTVPSRLLGRGPSENKHDRPAFSQRLHSGLRSSPEAELAWVRKIRLYGSQ